MKTDHLGQKPAEPKTRVGDARHAHLPKALKQESTAQELVANRSSSLQGTNSKIGELRQEDLSRRRTTLIPKPGRTELHSVFRQICLGEKTLNKSLLPCGRVSPGAMGAHPERKAGRSQRCGPKGASNRRNPKHTSCKFHYDGRIYDVSAGV